MSAGDEGVVERARRGDREAFGALVKKYQRRVYATAHHITGNHQDADDVAQEAFIRAYRGLPRFDGRADFFTWLYRIVVNVALNLVRSRARRGGDPIDGVAGSKLEARVADPSRSAEERQRLTRVLAAVEALSPSLRVTLVLAAVEELPYKRIAEILECPEGTVAWRVNQARHKLRQALADLIPDSEGEEAADVVLRRAKQAVGAP